MKSLKIMLLIVVCLSGWGVIAKAEVGVVGLVNRYVDLGGGAFRYESGELNSQSGFAPGGPSFVRPYGSDITPTVVAALAGRPVMSLRQYILFGKSPGYKDQMKYFTRSLETFSDMGEPFVILSAIDPANVAPDKTPKVSIFAIDPIASESRGTGKFLVTFDAPVKKNIRVKFDISGNATYGEDYQKIAHSIIIPAGNISGIIEIFPINDAIAEDTENMVITLSNDTLDYLIARRYRARIKILDDDK
jgi:hypothetical protein